MRQEEQERFSNEKTTPDQGVRRVDYHVVAWGVLVVAGSLFFPDRSILLGATAGAVLAVANWLIFRWVAVRLALVANPGRFMVFLAIKSFAVFGLIALVLYTKMVHPMAFAAGLSALVAGIFSRSLVKTFLAGDAALKDQGR